VNGGTRTLAATLAGIPGDSGPAARPGADGRPAARRGLILATCCSALFMVGLDNTIVNTGLPAMGRSLHAGVGGMQWIIAAYTVTLAGTLMFSGSAADRIGRRTVFQAGLALFVLGSWMCSMAPSLAWLICARVLQGAGGSMLNPAALGIITGMYDRPGGRARAIGVWDSAFGISMALGPVLGGLLVSAEGWRGVFWANIPVGLIALALTAVIVPDSRPSAPRRASRAGQGLVLITLACLTAGIIAGPGAGWLAPETMLLFAGSAASLALLLAYEPRRKEPLIQLHRGRGGALAGAVVIAVCAIAALAGFLFLTAFYLQDVRGMSALRAGLAVVPMPAEMALCSPLAARLIARRGARIPAVAAGAALALASVSLSRQTGTTPEGDLCVAYALFGAGVGLASPVITYGVMSALPPEQASLASGLNSSSRQLGQSLGVAAVGAILAASLHGPMMAGFIPASRTGWLLLAGCGIAVLLAGAVTATEWSTAASRSGPAPQARTRVPLRPRVAAAVAALRGGQEEAVDDHVAEQQGHRRGEVSRPAGRRYRGRHRKTGAAPEAETRAAGTAAGAGDGGPGQLIRAEARCAGRS